MDIFVDESGDLGFGPKSTKYFIVAYLFMRGTPAFRDEFRWLFLKLKRRHKYFHEELHFSQSTDTIRRKGLQLICKDSNCSAGVIIVNKKKIRKTSQFYTDLELLYRYIIVDTVLHATIPRLNSREKINFILDSRIPISQRKLFDEYAKRKGYQINEELGNKTFSRYRLTIKHINSKYEPCLQAVDFIAGAEFQRYENGNDTYHKIIEAMIAEYRSWPY
jgi:hypothetical protein